MLDARLEILTAVKLVFVVFWVTVPYSMMVRYQRSEDCAASMFRANLEDGGHHITRRNNSENHVFCPHIYIVYILITVFKLTEKLIFEFSLQRNHPFHETRSLCKSFTVTA